MLEEKIEGWKPRIKLRMGIMDDLNSNLVKIVIVAEL